MAAQNDDIRPGEVRAATDPATAPHDAGVVFIGRIGADQVADYARRKEMSEAEVETWLAQNLAYTPNKAAPERKIA